MTWLRRWWRAWLRRPCPHEVRKPVRLVEDWRRSYIAECVECGDLAIVDKVPK